MTSPVEPLIEEADKVEDKIAETPPGIDRDRLIERLESLERKIDKLTATPIAPSPAPVVVPDPTENAPEPDPVVPRKRGMWWGDNAD